MFRKLLFTVCSVFAVFAWGSAVAQVGSQPLQLTDPAEIKAATALNARIEALGKQVMVCVEKKLAPPERCFCNYPQELAALKAEHQAVLRQYPSWATRAVAWTAGAPGSSVGYTVAVAHLGPQLASCPGK